MKKGVIVYVAGENSSGESRFDQNDFAREYGLSADSMEFVSRSRGHSDIHDAWWKLTVKGMQMITCMIAELDDKGSLMLTGHQMRLCG